MKTDVRIEDGKPIIFYLDEVDRRKMIQSYRQGEGFNEASRAYIRSLKKPETEEEFFLTFKMLSEHFLTLSKVYKRHLDN